MAEEEKDAEDRTEAATPERIEKARKDGNVALSRETVQVASLGGGALGLAMMGPDSGRALMEASAALFAGVHATTIPIAATALLEAAAPMLLGATGLAAAGAVAATLLQTQFLVSGKSMMPQADRISPLAGAKRLFGMHAIEELVRMLLKLGAVGTALWWQLDDLAIVTASLAEGPEALAAAISTRLGGLLAAAVAAMAGIGAIDMLWVRLRHARKLRMSIEDIKEEMKNSEGNPHQKAHRLALARSRSRRRAVAAVAKATVVVTNPTHYAVALAYDRGKDAAPRIIARGVDALAARMREAADKHGVPIIPNPPLARALYRLPEDAQIPAEHFRAVAEIIALVWKLKQPRR
jgi:flagellar biosynthetic protein FlhB